MDDESLIRNVIKRVESDGYEVLQTVSSDYGHTIKLLIEKNGRKKLLPIRECFYDTDEDGNRTEFHGVINFF